VAERQETFLDAVQRRPVQRCVSLSWSELWTSESEICTRIETDKLGVLPNLSGICSRLAPSLACSSYKMKNLI